MTRIIAVNRFYWPDHSATSQLLTDLAEHMTRQGHEVTVVTGRQRYDDPAARLPACEDHEGVRIRRIWTSRFGRHWLPGRAVDYATFYVLAFSALLAETRAGDTILAKTDPPLISVVAWLAARSKRAELVNWCQDLFPEIARALGARVPCYVLLKRLRNGSLHAARTNVVICSAMRDRLLEEGIPPERIRIIHNWADAAIRPLARGRASDEPFTITYSGNLGRAHGVDGIIALIRNTADIPDLCFRFVGGGAGHADLKAATADLPASRVQFEPYAPRNELPESLAHADLHLVSLSPECEGLIMPSKIYGILAAGRPVLFLGHAEGAVARLITRHRVGAIISIGRPETWRSSIAVLMEDLSRGEGHAQCTHATQATYRAASSLGVWHEALAGAVPVRMLPEFV